MSFSKCNKCGTEVITHEKTCPVCGSPVNKRPLIHYLYAFSVIILILVLGTQVYNFFDKKQKEEERKVQAALVAKLEKERQQQELENEKQRVEAERRRIENEIKRAEELEKAKKDIIVFKNNLFNMLNQQNIKIVRNVYLDKDLPQQVIIVMEPFWHVRNKHLRKNDATLFWKLWASINSPSNPDRARIKLVSINNDSVGGSRIWAGSLIWVED